MLYSTQTYFVSILDLYLVIKACQLRDRVFVNLICLMSRAVVNVPRFPGLRVRITFRVIISDVGNRETEPLTAHIYPRKYGIMTSDAQRDITSVKSFHLS